MKYLLTDQHSIRLKFRLLEDKDFEEWMTLFDDKDAARFVGLGHLDSRDECCSTWFERAKDRYSNNLGGMNVLVCKETNQLIGQAGLLVQNVDGALMMEVGYSILPKHWHKGYATEAAIKCRDFAFENNYTENLISIIHTENTGSMKVARNNGMSLFRSTIFKDMPVHIFRITKQEWQGL